MAKSIKLKDNTYLDSKGIVHNRALLSDILNKSITINTNYKICYINSVTVNTSKSYQVLNYVIPNDGTYLIIGNLNTNYYGESGRELKVNLARNWDVFSQFIGVCNSYTYTLSTSISAIYQFKKDDKLEVYYSNTDDTKKWSCGGGVIYLLRLNDDTY